MINLCDRRRVLGVSCEDYRQNGAFAEFVAVPPRILYRVPDALPFEHAAMVEPFAIALHAVRRSPPGLNDTVVVVGAGMIGLALVQGLSNTGCGKLIVLDVADVTPALAPAMFACSRVAGWSAHILEQKRTGRLFRPSARYVGPAPRSLSTL